MGPSSWDDVDLKGAGLRHTETGLPGGGGVCGGCCPGSFLSLSPFTTQIMVISIFLPAFISGTEVLHGMVGEFIK